MRAVGLSLAMLLVASCSGRTTEGPRAEQVVTQFYAAFAQQDDGTACALLAPETRHEVEKSAKAPCSDAIGDADLPDLGQVTAIDVYGNEARVVSKSDTVFVSDFSGTWKIVAAGCTEQGDLPYDCEIKGG